MWKNVKKTAWSHCSKFFIFLKTLGNEWMTISNLISLTFPSQLSSLAQCAYVCVNFCPEWHLMMEILLLSLLSSSWWVVVLRASQLAGWLDWHRRQTSGEQQTCMHPHPHHCRRRPDDGCCPLVGAIPFYLAVTHNQEPGHVLLEEQRRRQCSPGGKKDSKVARSAPS